MTRTGRALVIGPVVVLGLSLTAVAAAPAEPRPAVVEPIAAHPPASAEAAEVLTLPFLADIVAPSRSLHCAAPRWRSSRQDGATRRGRAPRGGTGGAERPKRFTERPRWDAGGAAPRASRAAI